MSFVQHVPIWVWPLLLGLIVLAAISTRERRTPLVVIYALPLLGLLSVRAVAGFEVGGGIWAGFALGYGLGAAVGWRKQLGWIIAKTAGRLHQRGEGLTAAAIAVLFAMNFARGTLAAIAPQTLADLTVALGFALVAGLASGSFAGRALRVAVTPAR